MSKLINNDGTFRKALAAAVALVPSRPADKVGQDHGRGGHAGNGGTSYYPDDPTRCKMRPATEMGRGCYRDECGNAWIKVNGMWRKIRNANSVRERFMSAYAIVPVTNTADATGYVEVAPTVPHFIPFAMVLRVTAPAASLITNDSTLLTSLRIGNREQEVGKINNQNGVTSVQTGIMFSVFGPDSFNSQFNWDEATPSLGLRADFLIGQSAVADQVARVNIVVFGTTFED